MTGTPNRPRSVSSFSLFSSSSPFSSFSSSSPFSPFVAALCKSGVIRFTIRSRA